MPPILPPSTPRHAPHRHATALEDSPVSELTREGRALQAQAEGASSQFVAACQLSQADGGELRDKLALLNRTLRSTEE